MYRADFNERLKFYPQINSEYFEGQIEVVNLEENIERGMPIQDEDESIRTGSSL